MPRGAIVVMGIDVVMGSGGGEERDGGERKGCRGKGWWASGRDSGRAERAVPRRGTIVVSPTQVVPEVLAVWGSDYKRRDSVS